MIGWACIGRHSPVFAARADEIEIYNPKGRLIGRINLPERCANLCVGGTYRNRLFMAAAKSVYALYGIMQGARGG